MFFLKSNYPLGALNTFGVECDAAYFAQFTSIDELTEIFEYVLCHNLTWWPLGGGSNVIFTGNFDGVIIQCTAKSIEYKDGLVIADAGANWDDLVAWCVERNYAGLENLSYIPGSVGASPVQNIGAYGAEAGDCIEWVEYFDFYTASVCRIAGSECKFGYRDSIFKGELKGNAVVIRVAYRINEKFDPENAQLNYGDLRARVESTGEISLANIRKAVIEIRQEKLPEPAVEPNAGSFFKNPVVSQDIAHKIRAQHPDITLYPTLGGGVKVPAGALIDRAGWKGKRLGKVGIHSKQALVIVNYDKGSATDILNLAGAIEKDVEEKFGVTLQMEVNIL